MSLLSVAELRPRVTSPLNDAQLQDLIDFVEDSLEPFVGEAASASQTETMAGYTRSLFLKRPVATITSVTEYDALTSATGTALTNGTEFYTWPDEARLERVGRKWGARVTVVYVPTDDTIARKGAIIDLARIYLAQTPLKAESIGSDFSYQAPDNWNGHIRQVLRRLRFPVY